MASSITDRVREV